MVLFEVPVADLDDEDERQVEWAVPSGWLAEALSGSEATPAGPAGRLCLRLRKCGREVMVRGQVQVAVVMPCARTLEPVDVSVNAEIFLLLSKGSTPSEQAKFAPARRRGTAERTRRRGREPEELLTDDDAARDTYGGDRIVLDRYVREFILLELPLMPLRPDAPAAIGSTPSASPEGKRLDPRLAPLAAIASRLRKQE